jgi:GntR family transcriptional regulator, transcriptional repressor for pyruvate dehydrogenase complex
MTSTDTGSTVSSPGPTPGAETGGGVAGPRINLPVSRLQPAYQQVADQLRTLIIQGELVSGDRLPPEAELGSSFGVSRSTVR